MTDPETGESTPFTLLPYVREGFEPDREYDPSEPKLEGRSEITVKTDIEGRRKDTSNWETESATVGLRMYGPGDITGIDDRQVVRTVPRADTTTFPPTYFPHIEFYRPDLPWMFSPESANVTEGDKLRPWFTLVVVPTEGEATVEPPGTRPNPVLTAPTSELPPIEESWAWTHAQAVGNVLDQMDDDDESDPNDLFAARSDQTVSRVLCPRKLSKGTSYVACVVPTFEPGRRAGLGEEPFGDQREGSTDDKELTVDPAWNVSADRTVDLPVYYRWEFTTGDRGDFEAALDKMTPRNLSKPEYDIGFREFDLSEPGPAPLNLTKELTGEVSGALKTIGDEPTEWNRDSKLHTLLTDPDTLVETPSDSPARNLPIVGPPEYGKWPPLAFGWSEDPPPRLVWLRELNLTPRHRIPAGYGTQVIREHQDELVTEAWAQFDKLEPGIRTQLDRRNIGREIETDVQNTLERIDDVRTFRDIERAREAIRIQDMLDRLNGDGQPDPGGGDIDIPGGEYGLGRDVVESVLRNGAMTGNMEDVLGSLGGEGGTTQPGSDGTTQPGVAETFRADTVFRRTHGKLMSVANELGRVKTIRENERAGNALPDLQTDGGAGARIPDRVPDFGSLSRVDSATRPGGVFAKRTRADTDVSTIGEGLFAGGTAHEGVSEPRTETTAPEWLLDEEGNRMSLREAFQALSGEMKRVPKALIQLRSLREDTMGVAERLDAIDAELGEEGEEDVPGRQMRAEEVATEEPSIAKQVDLLEESIAAANYALQRAVGADVTAVSSELTGEKVQTSFERIENARELLTAAVDRIAAGAEAAGQPERGNGPNDDAEERPAIRREDIEAAREATGVIVEQTEGLEAYIPTEITRTSEPMSAVEETTPEPDPTATNDLLYDEIELEDQPNLPGLHAGERWAISKAGQAVFETDFSGESIEAVDDVMRGGPMAAPEFDRPMYEPLKALSTEYILPGVGNVPNNTIGALTTNRKFIEAYMCGLSHEFGRELLWREFPADRRGTYFRRFWNYDGPGDPPDEHDITKIHEWEGELESNAPDESDESGVSNRVVLLIKGDLLQAFPDTRIYMVPAVAERRSDAESPYLAEDGHEIWDRKPLFENEVFDPGSRANYGNTEESPNPGAYVKDDETKKDSGASFETRDSGGQHVVPKEPIVHGKLTGGVTFLMFDLDTDAARGRDFTFDDSMNPKHPNQLGWFFVFEEPVGEIRFGLDSNNEFQDDEIRDAAHPSGDPYEGLYTDVGSYPAKVQLGSTGTREKVEGCKSWQEGGGEERHWSALSWGHLVRHDDIPSPKDDRRAQVKAEQGLVDDITYVRVAGENSHAPAGVNDGVEDGAWWDKDGDPGERIARWGANSANMARITWQYPVRAAYHVDDLLPEDSADVQDDGPTNGGDSS